MKKIKNKILKLGLSFKKEISTLVILCFIVLVGFSVGAILTKNMILAPMGLASMVVVIGVFLSRYSSLEAAQRQEDLTEFTLIFTFFKVYLHNGVSVYSALNQVSKFTNERLCDYFKHLIEDIDTDKSVDPFIRFARNFNELIIEEMMISIYQMIDDGNNSAYLTQFEMIFDKFSEELYKKELAGKEKKLNSLSMMPLVGSSLLIVMVTVGVLTVIGEMIYVI